MQPSDKNPSIDNIISAFMGKDRRATISADQCMTCDAENVSAGLRTPLDRKEYAISGMCQRCQDETFYEGE